MWMTGDDDGCPWADGDGDGEDQGDDWTDTSLIPISIRALVRHGPHAAYVDIPTVAEDITSVSVPGRRCV